MKLHTIELSKTNVIKITIYKMEIQNSTINDIDEIFSLLIKEERRNNTWLY